MALVAGQHDVGGFVQEGPHPPTPAFGLLPTQSDLPGLILPGDQAQIGADVSGSADARGVVDRSYKGRSGQLAYAWNLVSAQHFGGLASRGSSLSWARGCIGLEHADVGYEIARAGCRSLKALRALRITATSMTSWRRAPWTGVM